MKKFVLLALLFIPVASFAASSVRVLGAKPGTTTGTTGTTAASAKVLPAKAATSTLSTSGSASNSRIGTVRTKPKTTTGTVSSTTTASTGSASRFPVITPAHSYNSVNKPQTAGGTTVVNLENYYTKDEVDEKFDDPRFDMIHIGDPTGNWSKADIDKLNGNYVFFWVEE